MTAHRLMTVAVALLCACVITAAGCGSADTATTASSTAITGTTAAADTGPTTKTASTSNTAVSEATSGETAHLYPVSVDNKWGFIDGTGAIRIEAVFDDVRPFSEGLAAVAVGKNPAAKWGFVDTSGTMVISPQFDIAGSFTDGLAAVCILDAHWGFVDKTGDIVIPMRYWLSSGSFSEGLCAVSVESEGLGGYIDRTGTMVIEPQFTTTGDFSEGLAAAMTGGSNSDQHGFIDKTGDWVIALPPDLLPGTYPNFSEGLAVVGRPSSIPGRAPFPCGYIDKTGAVVIQPQFDFAEPFSEGLAAVGMVAGRENALFGYIDATGTWVVRPQYDFVGPFSEGLAAVGMLLPIDQSTDWVFSGHFRWGYIDKTGTVVIPVQYEGLFAYPFVGGLARLDVETSRGSLSATYIDKTGKVIWQGE